MSQFFLTEGFEQEDFENTAKRYEGFGKDLYEIIKEELPDIYERLKFYRNTKIQIEDSYAEFLNIINGFAIQLDPLCEVIVLWNDKK